VEILSRYRIFLVQLENARPDIYCAAFRISKWWHLCWRRAANSDPVPPYPFGHHCQPLGSGRQETGL